VLKFNKGVDKMGRPSGTKNTMKTTEEKELIVRRYLNGESAIKIARENDIDRKRIHIWVKKYEKDGFEGLKSNTGKTSKSHKNMGIHLRKPKNKIEELELEIMKKDIEIARLKKGYMVKGVGAEKEFVTTFDKNIK
jgi:transposase-like protein